MTDPALIHPIAEYLLRRKTSPSLMVALDGVDAAGKTTLADSLGGELERRGQRVIRASIDGFHNPSAIRHARGNFSPEGYFFDSFNYAALKESLLVPLGKGGNGKYRVNVFNFRSDAAAEAETLQAPGDFILLFDGVFLFRPELRGYWDVKIFVEVSFEESLRRALRRDRPLFRDIREIEERYTRRYIPGQKLYLDQGHPEAMADLVVHNEDYLRPILEIIRIGDDGPRTIDHRR
jgi:uridine kinase